MCISSQSAVSLKWYDAGSTSIIHEKKIPLVVASPVSGFNYFKAFKHGLVPDVDTVGRS